MELFGGLHGAAGATKASPIVSELNLIEEFASRMTRASLAMRVPVASRTRVERFEASRARVARR